MNTKTITLILFILLFKLNYGQEIKTYKGKFEQGNAEYEYYDDAEKGRIYNGKFEYLCNEYYKTYQIPVNFILRKVTKYICYYKNDKKQGVFKYNFSIELDTLNSKYDINNRNDLINIDRIKKIKTREDYEMEGYYEKGHRNGIWSFKKKNQIFDTLNCKTYDNYSSRQINFKNDTIIGKYDFNIDKYNVKGEFDNEGYFTGIINSLCDNKYSESYIIYKSIIISKTLLDKETGKFIDNFNFKETKPFIDDKTIYNNNRIYSCRPVSMVGKESRPFDIIDGYFSDSIPLIDPIRQSYKGQYFIQPFSVPYRK